MKQAETLKSFLGEFSPKSILVIGPIGERLIGSFLDAHPQCELAIAKPLEVVSKPDGLGRYDLVFVSHAIENLSFEAGTQLIARLRDIHAKRLILLVLMNDERGGSCWRKADFLALGLVQLTENSIEDKTLHIYGYDILSYKTKPDWLNSRYWANPDIYDKYWW